MKKRDRRRLSASNALIGKVVYPRPPFTYAEELVRAMDDKVLEQTANVAMLPGIVSASYAMPDAHWGYGFPIGGVAALTVPYSGIVIWKSLSTSSKKASKGSSARSSSSVSSTGGTGCAGSMACSSARRIRK